MNMQNRKYQKAVECLHSIGMKVEYRFRHEDMQWNPAAKPSFLWEFVEYRVSPSELKNEVKFAKIILRARRWK